MKHLIPILLCCLTLLWTGCSQKAVIKTQYVKQEVPDYLFECPNIEKPIAKTEKDIIKAYVDLYHNYIVCKTSINNIKVLVNTSEK